MISFLADALVPVLFLALFAGIMWWAFMFERRGVEALKNLVTRHAGASFIPRQRAPMYAQRGNDPTSFYWRGGVKLTHQGYDAALYSRGIKSVRRRPGKRVISYSQVWTVATTLKSTRSAYGSICRGTGSLNNVFTDTVKASPTKSPLAGTGGAGDVTEFASPGVKAVLDEMYSLGPLHVEILPSGTSSALNYSFSNSKRHLTPDEWLYRAQLGINLARALETK